MEVETTGGEQLGTGRGTGGVEVGRDQSGRMSWCEIMLWCALVIFCWSGLVGGIGGSGKVACGT